MDHLKPLGLKRENWGGKRKGGGFYHRLFFLIFRQIFVIIFIESKKGDNLMTVDVLKALAILLESCQEQESCKTCPMAQFCGKMPCEW